MDFEQAREQCENARVLREDGMCAYATKMKRCSEDECPSCDYSGNEKQMEKDE